MKTYEVAALLGLATPTIRAWTSGEFKQYMSQSAQGDGGRHRHFTEQDARILAFVAALKHESKPRNEIHATLKRLQQEGWADLPPMPSAPPGVGPISMIPREAAETAVMTQRQALLREIALKDERIESLEKLVTELQERIEKAQETREQLLRQLIEAQTELRLYREGRLRPDNDRG